MRTPFKILSIDGGGIRGMMPARLLSELEDELTREGKNPRLCDYFDLICGTSTGGIIALGLALGMPAQDVLKLYRDNASNIFKKKTLRLGFFNSIYSNDFLSSPEKSLAGQRRAFVDEKKNIGAVIAMLFER